MENSDKTIIEEKGSMHPFMRPYNPLAKVFAGIAVVAGGTLLFMDKLGYEIPNWIFSWPVLLILIGIYIGIKHSFRHMSWLILIAIGSLFLATRIVSNVSITPYLWPIGIILLGLFIIFKPKRKMHHNKWRGKWDKCQDRFQVQDSSEDHLSSVAVFSGVKKNIFSKDFKGGEVSNTFGGTELNLINADINGKVVLEISQVFGGTVLIIPAHWELESEMVSIMGGIDDKRSINNLNIDRSKILLLRGTNIMGGVEIKSY